mmetsp:Transcript_12245/g.29650  ORF Transcript_12245/g.29650 Transcript_12245/m.29650 type:complete len:250 (+) Transcript_12245:1539-2288(+)
MVTGRRSRLRNARTDATAGPTLEGRRSGAGLKVIFAARGERRSRPRTMTGSSAADNLVSLLLIGCEVLSWLPRSNGWCVFDALFAAPSRPSLNLSWKSARRHTVGSWIRKCSPPGVTRAHIAGWRVSRRRDAPAPVPIPVSASLGIPSSPPLTWDSAAVVTKAWSNGPCAGLCHISTGNAARGSMSSTWRPRIDTSVDRPPPGPTPSAAPHTNLNPSSDASKISSAPSTIDSDARGSDSSMRPSLMCAC